MIETSQELIEKMRAEQTVSARVSIVSYKAQTIKEGSNNVNEHLQDVGICKDTGEAEYYELYNMSQLHNLRMNESGNYAIFEGEGISLSGMQCISKTNKNNQFGWWSEWLSDENGYFNPSVPSAYPVLEWSTKQTGQNKLNIVFSKIKDEYAVNFSVDIIYNDGNEDKTISYDIEDNNKSIYTIEDIPDFSNFYNNAGVIRIKITKWSKPNARAKVCQLSFGEILEYEDDKIVKLDVTKGVSLTNENTESKELSLTIQDEEEEYNIFEPTGKLVSLNTNSALSLELGCLIDDFIYYVKVDEFNIERPKKEQNSLEVSITGYGIINRHSNTDFGANYYEKHYPQGILDAIFGYEEEIFFKIDSSLNNMQIRSQYGTVKIPDGLNKVATAVCGNVIETIDNTVLIKQIKESNPVARINLENMMTNPEIEKEDVPSEIDINVYAPTDKGNETIFDQKLNLIEAQWNTFKYNKEHTAPPYTAKRTFDLGGEDTTVDMQGVVFLEDRAGWSPLSGGDSQIVITGHVIELSSTAQKFYTNNTGNKTQSIDNESINNTTQAKKIFNWLFDNYLKCFKYKVEIQDAFTYEIGDTVQIETGIYVNGEMIVRNAIITNIEYEYSGALHYTLTLKGA